MSFKVGDFVKIKEGTLTESGKPMSNWAGKIVEMHPELCAIELDALTLDSLDDDYLLETLEEGSDATQYIFEYGDLIPSPERRDTETALQNAVKIIENRLEELDDAEEGECLDNEYWIGEFLESEFHDALTDEQKESAGFTISTFMDYTANYEGAYPEDWKPQDVTNACLNWIPKKVTAEIKFFNHYGDVVIAFLKFLDNKQYIQNAKTLQKAIAEIKHKIPVIANNPKNWGIAKSMMMGAEQSGYDINNKQDLDKYMNEYTHQTLSNIAMKQPRENPYKHIGRNDKVSVKYIDGKTEENVKFKKVEQDLIDKKCELISK
jgi:hypothetical protein